jgi:hypothetical protein
MMKERPPIRRNLESLDEPLNLNACDYCTWHVNTPKKRIAEPEASSAELRAALILGGKRASEAEFWLSKLANFEPLRRTLNDTRQVAKPSAAT